MECTCEMCGASITEEFEIFEAMASGICPNCLTIGSLYIVEEGAE